MTAEHIGQFTDKLNQLLSSAGSTLPGHQGPIKAVFNAEKSCFYAYIHLNERTQLGQTAANALEAALKTQSPELKNIRVSRLEKVFARAGASAGSQPVFHYVVEMDPETGWMPELASWYDTEHMPGLAQVSGCVQASRFLNHDHGPLSLACYDLLTEETLGSPPWLAVRGTEWSSRMRPRFTNTIRTMFRLL